MLTAKYDLVEDIDNCHIERADVKSNETDRRTLHASIRVAQR